PRRHRQGRPSAERLDLLRALRGSVPGAHPAAEPDAPLARARIRAASLARGDALGARALGVLRQAPEALCGRDVARDLRARPARQNCRPLPLAAARRRLDQISRPARAGDAHVPGAVEAKGRAMIYPLVVAGLVPAT